MAKLTTIDLPDATDKKSRKTIPIVLVAPDPEKGSPVVRYNKAHDAAKEAVATMDELKPELHKAGLPGVFGYNCDHSDPRDAEDYISSVHLTDRQSGEICMLTWTKKDMKNDPKQAETVFRTLRTRANLIANVNNYAVYEPVAVFDAGVFMVSGRFNEERYVAYMQALEKISAQYGVPNPLSCSKVLRPKPDFHEKRWQVFDLETNLTIQTVLPTQISLKPGKPVTPE